MEIIQADYHNPQHASAMGYLMNCYARDPMGGGAALPGEITENLAAELAKRPHAFSLLAYIKEEPVGLANCFELFSTFACRPLINIHDIVILDEYRGQGLGRAMLESVESIARERGCCKLTLEVLSGNHNAQSLYRQQGFSDYQLDPDKGHALFWQKDLGTST